MCANRVRSVGDIVGGAVKNILGGGEKDEKDEKKGGFFSIFGGGQKDEDEEKDKGGLFSFGDDDKKKDEDKGGFFSTIFNSDDDREKKSGFKGLFSEQEQGASAGGEDGGQTVGGSKDVGVSDGGTELLLVLSSTLQRSFESLQFNGLVRLIGFV